MEVVRRDWTPLAKRVQRELYERLFSDRPVEAYLADIVERVRNGELDEELVYHKNLRKDTGEYTATTPPHVAAARKSSRPSGRSIRYVVTTAGAEPLDNLTHPLDREHYVEKQIKPVAEPVLETLGLRLRARDRRRAPVRSQSDVSANQARALLAASRQRLVAQRELPRSAGTGRFQIQGAAALRPAAPASTPPPPRGSKFRRLIETLSTPISSAAHLLGRTI